MKSNILKYIQKRCKRLHGNRSSKTKANKKLFRELVHKTITDFPPLWIVFVLYSGKIFFITRNIVFYIFSNMLKCRYKISSATFISPSWWIEWKSRNEICSTWKTSDIEKNAKAEFGNGKSIDVNSPLWAPGG